MEGTAQNVVGGEPPAEVHAQRDSESRGLGAPSLSAPVSAVSRLLWLQRRAGNRAATAWVARTARPSGPAGARLQRQAVATPELTSDPQAVQYANQFAAQAGHKSLTDETRRLFRYVVKTYAPDRWADLGQNWTFDDYPFQSFTFAVMPNRAGVGFLLGIGPEFVKRIAAGDLGPVVKEFKSTWAELNKRLKSPQMPGQQPAVPGLGPERAEAIMSKIAARDPQGALDLLVRFKAEDGVIDRSFLVGQTMVFDPDHLADDATTDMGSWNYLTNKADPTGVTVGPSAFASLPYLYAVVMHEYQHVLERQSLAKQQNERNLRAQNLKSGGEVEAYAYEILHADESGLKALPAMIATAWQNLNEEFWRLDATEQAKTRSIARRARARAAELVKGTGVALDPFQAP